MSGSEKSFEVILEDFKATLNEKEKEQFKFVTLNDVRETALKIQRDQETLKTMMNMARLESFLEAMTQFGEVLGVFANANIFVAFVWGPLKFILQTASTWADSFETILDAYSQIGEHMPLLLQYKSLFGQRPDMKRVLALIYTDILNFHKKAVRMFRTKTEVWRQLFRSTWKNFGARFKGLLDNLEQHRKLISEQASLLHYEQSQNHYEQYQNDSQELHAHIKKYVEDRMEKMERLKKKEEDERKQKCLAVVAWLSASANTIPDHEKFRRIRAESAGSGRWILQNDKVQNWREMDTPVSSMLWIHGIPGAGKTILASVLVDACLQDSSYKTGYFYCEEDDSQRNDCISIYRGLLSQLLNHCQELIPYCYDKCVSSGEIHLTSTATAEQLLKLFFEKIPKQFIIVDGLDECNVAQRKLVLTFFNLVVEKCDEREPGKLRVLFISQDFPDIGKALQAAAVLKLTPEDNKNDIKSYVRDWSRRIQQKYPLTTMDQIQFIEEATQTRTQGMFLFAKLVMENLWAQETYGNLLDEIEVYPFPEGLADAYERIMRRLERCLGPKQWEIVLKLLGWMVCAKRPLKWREIQAAVSIVADEQDFDFDRERLASSVEEYCGSLIQVLPGDRVELVHTTAKIYIRDGNYIQPAAVECKLAALCLRYLTFDCFEDEISPEDLHLYTTNGFLSLQDYASAKWHQHIRAIISTSSIGFAADPASADSELAAAMEELDLGLEEFSSRYEEEILQPPILPEAKKSCERFSAYPFYTTLVQVWNHVYQQDGKGQEARKEIGIKALGEAVKRNREMLESLNSTIFAERIKVFYGDKHFKCPRPTCFYFHEGFTDAKARKQHINRHDRPFLCSVPDCNIAEFGLTSNKDLEKHKKLFHPEILDQADKFSSRTKPTAATPWECNLCGKKFTRGFHMRSHLRSHADERPFKCEECGKAFVRNNDKKRHEKLHARGR